MLQHNLEIVGQQMVEAIQDELDAADRVDSGRLRDSVRAEVITENDTMKLNIYSDFYLNMIDEGREKFTQKPPPYKALIPWVQRKGMSTTGKKMSVESIAFLVARSMGNRGGAYKTTAGQGLKQRVIDNVLLTKEDFFREALQQDLVNMVNDNVYKINK